MSPPLAGKPPFATDQPDSVFVDQSKPTPRPRKQNVDPIASGGARESAYTAFDSYFTGGNTPDSRASGVGDIGRGLMNAGPDSDDSSDDEAPRKQSQAADKHRALYAATTSGAVSDSLLSSYKHGNTVNTPEKQHTPTPEHLLSVSNVRTIRQPQAVMHARANDWLVSQHLEPSTPPGIARSMAQQQQQQQMSFMSTQAGAHPSAVPHALHIQMPEVHFMQGQPHLIPQRGPANLNNHYFDGTMPIYPTTRTPQPLPPPVTPIMPIFACPRKDSTIKFEENGILRGNSEETLLLRGAGGKGDDFWRRFSMVAKVDAMESSNKSAWLKKSENGSTRLSIWVWILGILLLLAIGGGIGVGWYYTHNKPASQPVAIGGSADEVSTSSSSVVAFTTSSKPTRVTAAPVATSTSDNSRRDTSLWHP